MITLTRRRVLQSQSMGTATHDLNADGKIDAADAIFSALNIWRDLDEDGVTDAGELYTLEALGIKSINVAANDNFQSQLAGAA